MKIERKQVSTKEGAISVYTGGKGHQILFISGGPGLSCGYLVDCFANLSEKYRLTFYDQPGCGHSTSEGEPSVEQSIAVTKRIMRNCAEAGDFTLVAHSWGAYLAVRSCLELGLIPSSSIFLNPVPLDKESFDTVGKRLVERVAPDDLEAIGELMSRRTRESGSELMRVALPAYCGRTDNLPNVVFDYNIDTYNSVASTLDQFDLWHMLTNMGRIKIVLGSTDYIFQSDFSKSGLQSSSFQTLHCGHFSMLDQKNLVVKIVEDFAI